MTLGSGQWTTSRIVADYRTASLSAWRKRERNECLDLTWEAGMKASTKNAPLPPPQPQWSAQHWWPRPDLGLCVDVGLVQISILLSDSQPLWLLLSQRPWQCGWLCVEVGAVLHQLAHLQSATTTTVSQLVLWAQSTTEDYIRAHNNNSMRLVFINNLSMKSINMSTIQHGNGLQHFQPEY